jgi:hypothetical protein
MDFQLLFHPRRASILKMLNEVTMFKVWIATIANFFFPGLGWLIIGEKQVAGVLWLAGVIGLTYVELSIQTAAPAYYWPMFLSVLVMNTGFALDVWKAGKAKLAMASS